MRHFKTLGLAAIAALAMSAVALASASSPVLRRNNEDGTPDANDDTAVSDGRVTSASLTAAVTNEFTVTKKTALQINCGQATTEVLRCNQPKAGDELRQRDISLL
jgi:hypothetical protein